MLIFPSAFCASVGFPILSIHGISEQTMLSALFVLDSKGKVIIARNYRGDVPMSVSERCGTPSARRERAGALALGALSAFFDLRATLDFRSTSRRKTRWINVLYSRTRVIHMFTSRFF